MSVKKARKESNAKKAREEKLSLAIENFIESKINTSMDITRDKLQAQIDREVSDKTLPVRAVSIVYGVVGAVAGIYLWLVAPGQIKTWTKEFVTQNMNEPALREAADNAIREKMANYVDQQIEPLKAEVAGFNKNIVASQEQIVMWQQSMEINQNALQSRLEIQQLMIGAKAGSRADYENILNIAADSSELQDYAKTALKEIELYFDSDRKQLLNETLVDKVSLKDPGYSIEEVINIFRIAPSLREAAVNTMYMLNRKSAVQELCSSVETETNLRVLARISRTMERLTEAKFLPLEYKKIESWCLQNQKKQEYLSPYKGYLDALGEIERGVNAQNISGIIQLLNKTIISDKEALHAQTLKAGLLIISGQTPEAEQELKLVEDIKGDYVWLLFWKSALALEQDRFKDAIDFLEKALEKSPARVEGEARFWKIFSPLFSEEEIEWPSEKNAIDD